MAVGVDGVGVDGVVPYLGAVLLTTASHLFILLGPMLILAWLMNLLAGFVQRRAIRVMGLGPYLAAFGWLGVSVHELGHAAFCPLFGHKIVEIKLFKPDPSTGTLGYVKHRSNPNNPYHTIGNFFIGIGPILFGTLVIYLGARYLLGPEVFSSMTEHRLNAVELSSIDSLTALAGSIWDSTLAVILQVFTLDRLLDWKTYAFLYLTISVGSAIKLSKPDVEGAAVGFGALIALIGLFNLTTLWIGDFAIEGLVAFTQLYAAFYTVMFFAILMNALAALLLLYLPSASVAAARGTARATATAVRTTAKAARGLPTKGPFR